MNNQKYLTMKQTKEKKNEVTHIQIAYSDPEELVELSLNEKFINYVHWKALEKIKYAIENNLGKVEIFNIFNMSLIIEVEKKNYKNVLETINKVYIKDEDFEECAKIQKLIDKL